MNKVIRASDGAAMTVADSRLVNGEYEIYAYDSAGVVGTYKRNELIYKLDVDMANGLVQLRETGKIESAERIMAFFRHIGVDPFAVLKRIANIPEEAAVQLWA